MPTPPEDYPISISPEIETLRKYLSDRSIPLDPEFLDITGLELAGAERIAEVLGYRIPNALGIVINYPGSDYQLVRLVSGPEKGPRCPKGRKVEAYLPALVDWDTVSGTLVICESALKALTWAQFGHNAMSSGGVGAVWMNSKQQWCDKFPHAALEGGAISKILIAFDSDIKDNHNVARDQRTLARALMDRYPDVEVLIHPLDPPPEDFGKAHWGCDDARHYYGDEWFKAWSGAKIGLEPERDKLKDHLDALDEQYVLVERTQEVVRLADGFSFNVNNFKNIQEAWRVVPTETAKVVKAAAWWIAAEKTRVVKDFIYTPGGQILDGENYNLWKPSELQPRQGDVSLWLDLINDAIECTETRKLLIQCMAYQVQNRGTRLQKLIYIAGTQVGTGKSTLVAILKEILGNKNTGWVTRTELESSYNAAWASKELVVLDDISKLKADTWGVIKTHITSQEVTVTEKYMPARQQPNYATFYISANVSDILTTDADDRRVLMVDFRPTTLHRDHDDPYWPNFHKWLATGGIEAIAHYLGTFDLEDFDPHFYPPYSAIKEIAVEATRDDDANWMIEFCDDPRSFLPEGKTVICGHELWMIYSRSAPSPANQHERRELCRVATVNFGMQKAVDKQVTLDGVRTTIYHVPGEGRHTYKLATDKRQVAIYKKNIKDHPITLDNDV
jgi:hypothetical protein